MPLGVACPSCQHNFHVPSTMNGRVVKCPRCEHAFAATEASAPAAPPPDVSPPAMPLSADGAAREPVAAAAAPPAAVPELDLAPTPEPAVPVAVMAAPFLALPRPAALPAAVPTPTAPPAPKRPQRRLTSLVVELPGAVVRGVSGGAQGVVTLALLALALGLAAWALTTLTRQGLLGVGLGVLGVLLGGAAVAALRTRQEKGLALPIAAILVNAQALLFAVLATNAPASVTPGPPPEQPPQPKPLTTIDSLRQDLKDANRDTRLKAVFALNDLARRLGDPALELMGLLHDDQATLRAAAAEALGQIGPPARVSYPALLETEATDVSDTVRTKAGAAARRVGSPTEADVGMLLEKLKDRSALLRSAAAQGLGLVPTEARLSAPALQEALNDSDPHVRISAANALSALSRKKKDDAEQVFPVLLAGLKEQDPAVRGRAALSLANLGDAAKKAAEPLAALMGDPNPKVRWQVAQALTAIGPAAANAEPQLRTALNSGNLKLELYAAQALWVTRSNLQGLPALLKGLKSTDLELRQTAAYMLQQIAEHKAAKDRDRAAELAKAVPALCAALKDSDPAVRGRAAYALRAVGPDPRAVPALTAALKHHDPLFRAYAAYTLAAFGPRAREAVPVLTELLNDKVAGVRPYAARALWSIQGDAKTVVPALVELLGEKEDEAVRSHAIHVLGALKKKAAAAVPELEEALKDKSPSVRTAAAETLGLIGAAARACYPQLNELAKDEMPEVRKAASDAMKEIGRPTCADVPLLVQALEDPRRPSYRTSAAVTLWMLNRDAHPAVKALAQALKDQEESVATTAAFALAAIGPKAAEAVPALAAALKNDKNSEELRSRAAYALGEIGPEDKVARDALSDALADLKLSVRLQAAQALGSVKQLPEPVWREVVKVLSDAAQAQKELKGVQRVMAAETLGRLGARPEAAALVKEVAVPALIKVLADEDEAVRTSAAVALGGLGVEGRKALPALIRRWRTPTRTSALPPPRRWPGSPSRRSGPRWAFAPGWRTRRCCSPARSSRTTTCARRRTPR